MCLRTALVTPVNTECHSWKLMRKDAMASNQDLQRLLDELGRLPGIGPKSAQRIAYHLLEADAEEARRLAQAILDVKEHVHFCSRWLQLRHGR